MQRSSRNLSSSRRTPSKPGTSPSLGASTARRGGGFGASNNNNNHKFATSSSQKKQNRPSTSTSATTASSSTVQLPTLLSKSSNPKSRTNTSNNNNTKSNSSVNTSGMTTSSPPSLSSPSKTPRSQQLPSSSARLSYLNQSTRSPPSRSIRSPRTQQQLGGLGNKSLNASVSRRNNSNSNSQRRQGTSTTSPSSLSMRSPNSNRPLQHQDSFRSSTTANTQAATSTAGTSVHQHQQNHQHQRSSNFLTSPTSQNSAAANGLPFNSSFSASSMFPSSFIVGGNANKSAAELVAQAEINASLKQQIQATESLNTQRQSKLDECVVMDAALHSRATQLRRKNITLDPLRHQVERLTMEVRRLEKDLSEIEEVLEVPERKLKQLERKQKETEESYIDRFELRPHRLSESVVRNILGGLTKKDYEEEQARSQKQNPLIMSTEDVHAAMRKHDDFDDDVDDPVKAHLRKHRYDESHFAEMQKRKKEQEEALEQEERDRAEESIQRDRERNDKEMSLRRIHDQRWFNGAGDGLLGGGATENYLLEQDFEGSLIPISIRQDVPDPRLLVGAGVAVVGDERTTSADLDAQVTKRKYAWEDIPIKPSAVSMMIMDRREERNNNNNNNNNNNIYNSPTSNIHNNDALALLPVDDDDDSNEVRGGGRQEQQPNQNQVVTTPTTFDAEKWMLKHVREVEATCPADASIARQSSIHEGVNRRHRTKFVRERMRQEVFEGERGKRGSW